MQGTFKVHLPVTKFLPLFANKNLEVIPTIPYMKKGTSGLLILLATKKNKMK